MDLMMFNLFFFQAEDGIRDSSVTGVQTCALPIYVSACNPSSAQPAFTLPIRSASRRAESKVILLNVSATRGLPPRPSYTRFDGGNRSEERRVGKEGRSRWSPYH